MVLMGSNPHHSWLGLTEQQNLTFDKGGKCVGDFRGIVRFWKFGEGSGAKFEQKTQVLQNG